MGSAILTSRCSFGLRGESGSRVRCFFSEVVSLLCGVIPKACCPYIHFPKLG
jgi:hypothetical protein